MNWKTTAAFVAFMTVAMALNAPAFADANNLQKIVAGMKVFGCDMQTAKSGAVTHVQVLCDQQKVIDSFPLIQQMHLMNPDITQTQINVMPSALSSVFLQEMTATLIHPLYQSTGAQETSWVGGLIVADAYGHLKSHAVFTFRFNRTLDGRVNWDNFDDANLPKIAPGYALTPWGGQVISELN
jgi:hypothetical protein